MQIQSSDINNGKLIIVSGDVDLHTSSRLRELLLSLTKKRTPLIVVNLKDVTYMDSSGIATLVEALKAMKAYSGTLRLCCLSSRLSEIFAFARLDKVFAIYPTEQNAITG